MKLLTSPFQGLKWLAPLLADDGSLHIPPQDLIQHKGISSWEVKVIVTRIDFLADQVTGTAIHQLTIDPARPFSGTEVPINITGEGTLLVTMQITAMSEDRPYCNRQYLAADIIAVVPPGVQNKVHNITHPAAPTIQHLSVGGGYTPIRQLVVQRE
ncbi:hypothetical protein [Chitinophaga pinensis]|uniref:Uncharacterized protein n=1 Tax=Chitinophaga pinensis (strain ATCC 43595 / DSM 2588 / LMG 13176 / NBRC 15968 / NCIMB 11800 / UQM 2034) TaxID=485918 RepID=A0A979GZM5_CHIPD|nr:hypothetical protein [Chitinophaga pinensis]ACU64056.1 hypothetical protein Cpin_6652 [Chitinophaga pinensis DSM 2588]